MNSFKIILLLVLPFYINNATADLVADYQFNNNLSSSLAGASDLVDLGAGTYESAVIDGVSDRVMRYSAGTGFRFDTTGLIANDEYSIVIIMALDDNDSYVKLADFSNLVNDEGLYNYDGTLLFYDQADGVDTVINNGQFHQLVFTRSAADEVIGYVDGVSQISFIDGFDESVVSLDNFIHFLRDDDDTSNGENSDGRVARIMVFDDVLSQAQIQSLGFGVPIPVPSLSQYMIIVLSLLLLLIGLRKVHVKRN